MRRRTNKKRLHIRRESSDYAIPSTSHYDTRRKTSRFDFSDNLTYTSEATRRFQTKRKEMSDIFSNDNHASTTYYEKRFSPERPSRTFYKSLKDEMRIAFKKHEETLKELSKH